MPETTHLKIDSKEGVGMGQNTTPRTCPIVLLPPARPQKFPESPKIAPPAGDQAFWEDTSHSSLNKTIG
jgi:hypothetical protein